MSPRRFDPVDFPAPPADCLRRLAEAADDWGGSWQTTDGKGGRLRLPVLAGVHHGWISGSVTVEETDAGSRLHFRVDDSAFEIHRPKVTMLSLAAIGALVFLVAPLVPRLLPLLPLGALLTLGAWLFLVSNLRNAGPEEFFESLTEPDTSPGEISLEP